jgi:hypothetical protein
MMNKTNDGAPHYAPVISLLLGAEWSVLLTQYCAGGKIETNEMGRACGAYGGR